MKIYEYEVAGRGQFPTDMLRYDAAWPANGDSAAELAIGYAEVNLREVRKVKLRSIQQPTVGRWQSFMWGVSKVTSYTSGR
jgi:hypothetical protein